MGFVPCSVSGILSTLHKKGVNELINRQIAQNEGLMHVVFYMNILTILVPVLL